MSILKDVICKEKVRVLPVEIQENDYKTAVEKNTRKVYGDRFSKYGYIYKNSIVMYQVSRFAEQDIQTQISALLFEVCFFAHAIYPPYNVPIDCQILKKRKQQTKDDQVALFLLQPVVVLDNITTKFFDRNPIQIQVEVRSEDIDDEEKYQKDDIVKASIYTGEPHLAKGQYFYRCLGNIQGIKSETYLQKQFENYEEKYIQNKKKFLLGQKKKKQNNGLRYNEETSQRQEGTELNDIGYIQFNELESDEEKDQQTSDNQIKQKKTKRKVPKNIYEDQSEEQSEQEDSEEEYDTEEEDEEEEEEQEEDDDLNDYGLDEEDEDAGDGEKEEIEPEEEAE